MRGYNKRTRSSNAKMLTSANCREKYKDLRLVVLRGDKDTNFMRNFK